MASAILPPGWERRRASKRSTCPVRHYQVDPFAAPIVDALSTPDFPCNFAGPAYQHGHLRFAGIDLADPHHVARAYEAINDYLASVEATARTDTREAAMKVLLLDVTVPEGSTAKAIRGCAWDLLARLHAHDLHVGNAWPNDIPVDMDDVRWSYCLAGVPIFVNMTSSELVLRRSRNLGRPLVLVIQPTDGLHLIAPLDHVGDRIRQRIRSRVDGYDRLAHSPALANAGDPGNCDWSQFWLDDTNVPSTWKPPQIPALPGVVGEGWSRG